MTAWKTINHIWLHVLRIWCLSPMNPFFFRFLRISISLMILMHTYAFAHFFTVHISLGCRKCVIGMLFDRKPGKLLSQTLYRTCDAAHVI